MSNDTVIDFYGIDSLLSKDERKVRDAVRALVDNECMPIIAEHFDKGTFPMEMIPRMASMELFGGHVAGYGCRKRSHMEYGLMCRELGRCDSGLRAMFSVQNSLVMFPIFKFGSAEQREKWLPKMARDITGARGILADHHIIRHLCDLEAISTLEGTAGMHTLIIGQEITGIAAFY